MAVNRAVQPTKGQGEPLEHYQLKTLPKPTASPKKVVVRVLLRPVNPTDSLVSRWGTWAHLDFSKVVVGSEGMGVVDEVGEGVTKVKVGQRVIPLIWSRYYSLGDGLWRDYIEVPEIDCVPVPDDISDEAAAQFVVNPWAAFGMLNRLQIPKGEYLLQTAAGSVLGRQMISIAKHFGIKTINVVRREEWIQPLKDLGADYVINSSKEDVKAKVKEITGGKGAYGAVDPILGDTVKIVANSVRDGGQVLLYGVLSGNEVRVDFLDLLRQVQLSSFLISDFSDDLPQRKETVKAILDLMSKKIIDPLVGKIYPLEDFKEAMKESERAGRGGKILLSSF